MYIRLMTTLNIRGPWKILTAALLLAICGCGSVNTGDWEGTKATIRRRYSNVPQLTTAELRRWLNSADRTAPLLIDARSKAEYEISHLPNAVRAETRDEANAVTDALPRDRAIVVYCSVGFRSSRIASWLDARGFKDVYNLEGSIFEWANKGYPVYRGSERVHVVHPYDENWGPLLNRSLWAALPD